VTRIAYVCNLYPSVSNTFIRREVEALRRRGVDVGTISIHRAPPEEVIADADREALRTTLAVLPPRLGRTGRAHLAALRRSPGGYLRALRFALCAGPAGARGRLWQLFYFAEAMVVWRHCERERRRHLHAHFAWQATDVAMIAAEFGGPGWSWSLTVHGPDEFFELSRNRLAAKVRHARFAVFISDFGRSQLMGRLDERDWPKLHVVHCGVNTDEFDAERAPERAGPLRVLSIGRLTPLKGQTVLLEAIAELRRRGVEVEATLAGPGPRREELERRARALGLEGSIQLPGAISQDRIRELYRRADVFCLSSFAEGIPVVLMEAMAMRVPVVATRINGIPELIEDGVSGLLVPPGRPDLLADALERLAGDPELRDRLAVAARARVEDDFELESCAAQLRSLFPSGVRDLPRAPLGRGSSRLVVPAR
jgi:colanic acid/amylovoran biosynthesis glycosyltransferase